MSGQHISRAGRHTHRQEERNYGKTDPKATTDLGVRARTMAFQYSGSVPSFFETVVHQLTRGTYILREQAYTRKVEGRNTQSTQKQNSGQLTHSLFRRGNGRTLSRLRSLLATCPIPLPFSYKPALVDKLHTSLLQCSAPLIQHESGYIDTPQATSTGLERFEAQHSCRRTQGLVLQQKDRITQATACRKNTEGGGGLQTAQHARSPTLD